MRGRWVAWAVVAAWLALVAGFAPFGTRLPDVVNDEYELPAASQTARVQGILRERFRGGDQRLALVVYRRDGGLVPADRALIAADARTLAAVENVAPPIPPFTPASPAGLVSADGEAAITIVPLVAGEVFRVRDTIDQLRERTSDSAGLDVHVTGFPALIADVNSVIEQADAKLLGTTVALVLVLLLVVYRSPALALIPLLVVGLAYAATTGLVYVLNRAAGLPVDSTSSSLLLILMFGAGTDYCLLLVARYRAALAEHGRMPDAVVAAVRAAAPAIAASGATVVAALLVALAGTFGVVRTLGLVNAIGVAVVMLASLTLLPALLAVLGPWAFWPQRGAAASRSGHVRAGRDGVWVRVGTTVRRRPAVWLALSVLSLAFAGLGLLAHDFDLHVRSGFRVETDGTRGYDALADAFPAGTVYPTTVLVERTDGPVGSADLASVRERLASADGVQTVADAGRRSTDGRIGALTVVFADDPLAEAALDRVETLREIAHDKDLRVIVGEGSGERYDYRAAGIRDLKVVAPLVLAVVLLTLIALLRALVAPLYLLATVILSFVGTLGAATLVYRYVFGQDGIDPVLPIIIFIFLVALGSDYNIFLMSRVREEAAEHGIHEGMLRALTATGPVITSAGMILAGTFCVLLVLPHYALADIGLAVALGVLIDTFLVRSICVPAIVWLVGERSWWPSGRRPRGAG